MDPDLSRRVHSIFSHACELAPGERAAYLAQTCGDDPMLRSKIDEMLAAIERSDAFLAKPILGSRASDSELPPGDEQVGHYCILRQIGSGGMASVFEAEQDHPRRRVAVKMLRTTLLHTSAIERFEYETHALARLQHPNIAQIYEAGTWKRDDESVPFFAMEFVPEARSITQFAQEEKLDVRAILGLFLKVCDAVQYGHQLGLIHRDLKPMNILVGANGEPKVIDFGVARSTDPRQAWITSSVDVGSIVGTLNYMCPEQCAPDAVVDTRCDVYALGVVLYELLSGRLPLDLTGVPLLEALRIIQEDDAARLKSHRADVADDLELIVSKAMCKDLSHRYASVAAMANDLRRWLSDLPIAARPPSVAYQARLFARRHRVPVIASALLLLTIIAGSVASAVFAMREHREVQRRLAAEQAAIRERNAALQNTYIATMSAGFTALNAGEVQELQAHMASAPPELRGWEWNLLVRMSHRSLATVKAHEDQIFAMTQSRDGSRLATGSRDGRVRVWQADNLRRVADMETTGHLPVFALSFDPSGRRLAIGAEDGSVSIFDLADNSMRRLDAHSGRVSNVCWLGADRIASVGRGVCVVTDVATAEPVTRWPARGVTASADGCTLASWDESGAITLRDTASMTVTQTLEFGGRVFAVAISNDGQHVAGGAEPGVVRVWDLAKPDSPTEHRVGRTHTLVRHLRFSADGSKVLASLGSDRTVEVISLSPDTPADQLHGHEDAVVAAWFSADESLIYSASWDGTIRVWGLTPRMRSDSVRQLTHSTDPNLIERQVLATAFSPDGALLATGGRDKRIRVFNVETGTEIATLEGHTNDVADLAFAPDGTLASASYDGSVRLWDISARTSRVLLDHRGDVWAVAFSPDGRRLASGGDDGIVRIWDVASGTVLLRLEPHRQRVNDLAFSPDGQRLVSGSRDGVVRLWAVGSGRLLREFDGHTRDVFAVTFCDVGRTICSGSRDQTIRVWDAATGEVLATLAGHGQIITSLSLLPDGKRIAAGSWTGHVLICDTASRRIVTTLRQNLGVIRSVRFSPDARYLGVAGYDGVVKLFDSSPPVVWSAPQE